MKRLNALLMLSLAALFSCNSRESNPADSGNASASVAVCKCQLDKMAALKIAEQIIGDRINNHVEYPNIWNLGSVDTSEFISMEDYFTSTKTKSLLVYLGGEAGLSAGNAHHLLMIFDCKDSLRMVWVGQVGDIDAAKIKDYNHDGIKDIVCESGMAWMGECNDLFEIYDFKEGEKNILYSAASAAVIDCGNENPLEQYKKGDTVETQVSSKIMQGHEPGQYYVKQLTTWKIHGGGSDETQRLRQLKTAYDSSMIELGTLTK